MRRLITAILATVLLTGLATVATEGTGNAYICNRAHCSSLERLSSGTEGLGAIHTWYGYGTSIYALGNYDRKLPNGWDTHYDFGWGNTQGFYVGVHYRVHITAINTLGRPEDRGWFNRGQYRLNFPVDYIADNVYNCGC